jgi:2-polyprenyl-3-methyl-5-hydroxy-6-metoxy-1,4-benzoquinol methylase
MLIFAAMSKIFTTEITSDQITSDNPIHQRLFKAYVVAKDYVKGNVLEVGCGEGRGVDVLIAQSESFTAVDKIEPLIKNLSTKFPKGKFMSMNIPPLGSLKDNTYDFVVSFQVIEHIQNDELFLREIHRVLNPGGTALLTTPNRKMSLTRNPWHVREYLPQELKSLAAKMFSYVEMRGITGNDKVMQYYTENKKSVERYTRWDILRVQYWLPAPLLRIPYEIMNRLNRNKLQTTDNVENAAEALDLLLIVKK